MMFGVKYDQSRKIIAKFICFFFLNYHFKETYTKSKCAEYQKSNFITYILL